jgi:predicted DNA-binding helix-hairpin-helix protein
MEGKRVSAEELKRVMAEDIDRLAEEIAEAMNVARDGRIIADTEELVREANAVFRQRMYEKALSLLQQKQEAFSPSGQSTQEQGHAADHAPDGKRANPDK